MAAEVAGEFEQLFAGRLWSLLSWQQLSDFWARIDRDAGWYLYHVGDALPAAPATAAEVERFIVETDALAINDVISPLDATKSATVQTVQADATTLGCGLGFGVGAGF